jgi:signal peptidase I
MAATLRDGQLVLTRRLWPFSRIRRGDVVVIASPELGRDVVKRVIGLPGETVAIREGSVSVDGRPLAEPYASSSVFTGTYEVPQASYFLLGDNRDVSSDSRTWREPYVARGALRGRLLGSVRVGASLRGPRSLRAGCVRRRTGLRRRLAGLSPARRTPPVPGATREPRGLR